VDKKISLRDQEKQQFPHIAPIFANALFFYGQQARCQNPLEPEP